MKYIINNIVKWWITLVGAALYFVAFGAYKNCKAIIGVADINTDNAVGVVFGNPGESVGLFISGVAANIIALVLLIVAILSVIYIIVNEYESPELIVAILNCILSVVTIVLNIAFIKIYWAIFLVIFVVVGIVYAMANSDRS